MVKKITCNIKIRNIENEIPSVTAFVTTAALNIKATYIEKNIHITDLTTKAALNTKATDLIQKPQTKYLTPQVLLLLLSSID